MVRLNWMRSVIFRLVCGLVVGGLLLSVGLTLLERRSSEALLAMEVTQRVATTTRNIQSVLKGLVGTGTQRELQEALSAFASEMHVRAARLTIPGATPVEFGEWADAGQTKIDTWHLAEHGLARGTEVNLKTFTLVQAPFAVDGRTAVLELLADGPAARDEVIERVYAQMTAQWLLMAVVTLLGLLLLRRWVTGPLLEVMALIGVHAGPEPFYRLATRKRDEFGRLAEAIGGMLTRLENTADQLRRRERAFQNLYQFAPVAMVNLDRGGRVAEANRRAADLLGLTTESELLHRSIVDFVIPDDRPMLRETFDRLILDSHARCEARIEVAGREVHTVIECSGVRDEDGLIQGVHLSMLDVSGLKVLESQLASKSRLLNLVIDHMSDAILLVDAAGRVAAHNQQLASLLHCRAGGRVNEVYDPEHFWDELGILKHDLFVDRLRQIGADNDRPAQERFEARAGTFLFQGIPVHDAGGAVVGRLWVVQEVTPQEQVQRLLNQQTNQLQALKRLAQQLSGVSDLRQLLLRAGQQIFDVFGVEAVGVALRRDSDGSRSYQILNRGPGSYLLDINRGLIESVEQQLMPQILSNHDVSFWPDLPRTLSWAKSFTAAGLTCVAAAPLRASADAQGILWIARRGGERLDRHHIYLLEALAPVIAGRIEIAQLWERFHEMECADPVTNLPNKLSLDREATRLANRPGYPWAAVMLKIDNFRKLNDALSHEAGNGLLCRIAALLQQANRKSCTVARIDGATFAVLAPGAGREQAVALAERLRLVVAGERVGVPNQEPWNLTASIGVACAPEDGRSASDILDRAAARMEAAKRTGRDRVVSDGSHRQAS